MDDELAVDARTRSQFHVLRAHLRIAGDGLGHVQRAARAELVRPDLVRDGITVTVVAHLAARSDED